MLFRSEGSPLPRPFVAAKKPADKSAGSWSSKTGQIRTFFLCRIGGQSVLKSDGLGAILVVERDQDSVIIQENGIHKNFNQRFPLLLLRYIELSKFQQPESNKIFVEAGLLQLFICNFCSQLIFLNFQRFQTLFRCPGVQAILDEMPIDTMEEKVIEK